MEYTGSVRVKTGKNGTVSYQIVIEGEKDPVTGKRMRSYQTVHGKKRDAIRLMNQIVAEKNAGTYFKGSNLLLKDWLDQWFRDYCIGHLEKTTLASYRDKIDHYIVPVLGNIPIGRLTGQEVQRWINRITESSPASGRKISPKSVRNALLVLRPALERAYVKLLTTARTKVTPTRQQRPACRKRLTTPAAGFTSKAIITSSEMKKLAVKEGTQSSVSARSVPS